MTSHDAICRTVGAVVIRAVMVTRATHRAVVDARQVLVITNKRRKLSRILKKIRFHGQRSTAACEGRFIVPPETEVDVVAWPTAS